MSTKKTDARKFTFQGKEVRLTTAFDNGSLARVAESERNVFDCWPYEPQEYTDDGIILAPLPQTDKANGEGQSANYAFHFRLTGCSGKKVVLRFHVPREKDKDGISVLYANPDFPLFSYDRRNWCRIDKKSLFDDPDVKGGKIVHAEQTFTEDIVWVAYQYPYTNDLLSDFIASVKGSKFVAIEIAGRSTEGRDIRQISVTDPAIPLAGKKVVWLTGLQHVAELGAGWGLESMVRFLVSADPVAAEARREFVFKVIPIVNVDALAEGRGRIHSSGKNPNREWEKPDPIAEIATIRKTLDDWKSRGNKINVFMDFHGFSSPTGKWWIPVMPADAYAGRQAEQYVRLQEAIRRHIPGKLGYDPSSSEGLAQGAACRRWGALSMSLDGWVYPSEKHADLASFHYLGKKVLYLTDIQSAGPSFVKALVEFTRE